MTLGISLQWSPREVRFLISEVPLYMDWDLSLEVWDVIKISLFKKTNYNFFCI